MATFNKRSFFDGMGNSLAAADVGSDATAFTELGAAQENFDTGGMRGGHRLLPTYAVSTSSRPWPSSVEMVSRAWRSRSRGASRWPAS